MFNLFNLNIKGFVDMNQIWVNVSMIPRTENLSEIKKDVPQKYRFKALIDTGATINIIPEYVREKIGEDVIPFKEGEKKPRITTGNCICNLGLFKGNKSHIFNLPQIFHVTEDKKYPILIGMDIIMKGKLVCDGDLFSFKIGYDYFMK